MKAAEEFELIKIKIKSTHPTRLHQSCHPSLLRPGNDILRRSRFSRRAHQQSAAEVDARLYGNVVGGLEEGALQDEREEEEDGEDRGVLEQLGGRHELHAEEGLLLFGSVLKITIIQNDLF